MQSYPFSQIPQSFHILPAHSLLRYRCSRCIHSTQSAEIIPMYTICPPLKKINKCDTLHPLWSADKTFEWKQGRGKKKKALWSKKSLQRGPAAKRRQSDKGGKSECAHFWEQVIERSASQSGAETRGWSRRFFFFFFPRRVNLSVCENGSEIS